MKKLLLLSERLPVCGIHRRGNKQQMFAGIFITELQNVFLSGLKDNLVETMSRGGEEKPRCRVQAEDHFLGLC